jgi:hypothetical protein
MTPSPAASTPNLTASPLTGLPGGPVRAVVVVKIENSPTARPQSGLPAADLVVEELVEGGETRFAAFFRSTDPGQVGPVRSVRNVDASIAGPTHGTLAFSGGAGPALAAVSGVGLRLVQEGDVAGAYLRIGTRAAPHNLYLRVASLWRSGGSSAPPGYLPFAAAPTTLTTGTPAASAALSFSSFERPSWDYDAAGRHWLRSETGGAAAVSATGARLVADNVLVLRVGLRDAGYKDPIGNPVPETVLTGSGSAVLLNGGRQLACTWSKPAPASPLRLSGQDGRPILVPPGRTWIELVPQQGGSVQIR